MQTWRSRPLSGSWVWRAGQWARPAEGSAPPARADWSRRPRGRAGRPSLRAAASARSEGKWRAPSAAVRPPASSLPPLSPPSLPPRTARLRPRAGGAPHCTLWGRRSVRGMGQRAAAGGRNPRAARVSRGGLPGRARKQTRWCQRPELVLGPGPT